MSDANKSVIRRLFEEVWNKGNLPVADELLHRTILTMTLRHPNLGEVPRAKRRE